MLNVSAMRRIPTLFSHGGRENIGLSNQFPTAADAREKHLFIITRLTYRSLYTTYPCFHPSCVQYSTTYVSKGSFELLDETMYISNA